MCLLVVKPEGYLIADLLDLCHDAHNANTDGFGIASRSGERIVVRKGMIQPDAQAKAIRKLGTVEAIIHWRFGTSGSRDKLNCHPFVLADGSVFAHNGVLPIVPDSGISDTHTVARAPRDADELAEYLTPHISRCNKFALLRHDGHAVEIMGEEFGLWRDGVWYSNDHWDCRSFSRSCLEDEMASLVAEYGLKAVRKELRQQSALAKQDDFPRFSW